MTIKKANVCIKVVAVLFNLNPYPLETHKFHQNQEIMWQKE